jgi:hypothetical protein
MTAAGTRCMLSEARFSHLFDETEGFFCQPPFSLGFYFHVRKKLGGALSLSQTNRIPTAENVKYETKG